MALYGSLNNRMDEGRNLLGRPIRAGDDITMYFWSDRHCYYVSEVIDQRHIMVLPYHVVADHDKAGGMGHQNWLYFKSVNERNRYLNRFLKEGDRPYRTDLPEAKPDEWVFRWGQWRRVVRRLVDGKEVKGTAKLSGKVSFGVRDYYYDWEF